MDYYSVEGVHGLEHECAVLDAGLQEIEISVFVCLNACDDMWVHTSQQRRTLKAAERRVNGIQQAPKDKKKKKKSR